MGCSPAHHAEVHRELLNAGVVIDNDYPDVRTLVGMVPANAAEQRLFIVEIPDLDHLSQLERVNDTYLGRPILALVHSAHDALAAVRAGAAQVCMMPIQSEDFKAALDRIARQFGFTPSASRAIAVSGVTGGAGATLIAINLAAELAHAHRLNSILLELSLQMGRLAICLNSKPRYTTHDLLGDPDHMDMEMVRKALTDVAPNLHMLAAPYQSFKSIKVQLTDLQRMLSYVRRLASMVVMDMPHTFDDLHFGAFEAADEIVLVAEQKVPSLHAMMLLVDELQRRQVVGRIHLVVNRYNANHPELTASHICELMQAKEVITVVNDYTSASLSYDQGKPLHDIAAYSPIRKDLHRLADRLLGKTDHHRREHRSIVQKIASLLSPH